MRVRLSITIFLFLLLAQSVFAQVSNFRVMDYPRDSLIVLWDRVVGADRYFLRASNEDNLQEIKEKWVVGLNQTAHAAQIQPLSPTKRYKISIQAWKGNEKLGNFSLLRYKTPKGTYERNLEELTANGGFYYDPKYDIPHHAPSCCLFHTSIKPLPKPNDPASEYWTHFGAYLNDQFHWHQFLSDDGTGNLTMRVQQPITLGTKWPVTIKLDNDCGPTGRQAFYIFLTSTKQDAIPISPQEDNIPVDPTGYEIRLQGGSDGANGGVLHTSYWQTGVRISKNVINRGYTWANVRQVMGMKLYQDRIELLIDRNYDGSPELVHTIPADLTKWPTELWLYLTIGSYNQIKQNVQHGKRAGDKRDIHQYFHGGIWHIGQVAHDGAATRMDLSNCACTDNHNDTSPTAIMPTHKQFSEWSVPNVKLTYPRAYDAARVLNPFPVVIDATAALSAHFCAEVVKIKKLRLELDDAVVWSETLPQSQVTLKRSLNLDTSNWANGYHQLKAFAETVSGSEGYNISQDIYSYKSNLYVLVHNVPPQTTAPTISGSIRIDNGVAIPFLATPITPPMLITITSATGTIFNVRYTGTFTTNARFIAKSPLLLAQLQMLSAEGKWIEWADVDLAANVRKTELGWEYNLLSNLTIYNWYRKDETGGLNWRILARDCDGNETIFPYRWQYATTP